MLAGGIGSASAAEWIARGGQVVLADLPSQEETANAFLEAHGGAGVFVPTDTRELADLEAAAEAAKALGTLTCWFNNAGFGQPGDDVPGIREKGLSPELQNMLAVNTCAPSSLSLFALQNCGCHATRSW